MANKKSIEETVKVERMKTRLTEIASIAFGVAGVGLASKGIYGAVSGGGPEELFYIIASPFALVAAGLAYTWGRRRYSYQSK